MKKKKKRKRQRKGNCKSLQIECLIQQKKKEMFTSLLGQY